MKNQIPEKAYFEIEKMIASEDSVVGIDAKETHIIIIHMLLDIQERLNKIELKLSQKS
ncbi:MAG: hypothetical protein WD059_10845 [Balneolaceae bacterium]